MGSSEIVEGCSTMTRVPPTRGDRPQPRRRWRLVAPVLGLVLAAGGWSLSLELNRPSTASAAGTTSLPALQNLYAQDLVARINAERAVRTTPGTPIPQLQMDPGLTAQAQAWSAHLATTGAVADPSLPPCGGAASQICVFAANSGSSGYGYWPGDGSDGMDSAYMASAAHRQNALGAAYSDVGVGVTCSGNQAWTVELFGYAYGDIPSANARQSAQNASAGDPVGASPVVAGTPSGAPVYCPGQTYGPNGAVTPTGGQYRYPFSVAPVPGEPGAGPGAAVGMAATADANGYWVARSDGTVTAHGDAVNDGSMAGVALNAPIAHIVATADGRGYWLVAADGGIFSFGDAQFYGSMGGKPLNAPVVGIAPTPDGKGYWLVAADGGIFSFGDAVFRGSMGGLSLNAPVVGIAADRATSGYWLVASDGGIFSFGTPFFGSTGSLRLNQPVVGMATTGDGGGYWFVASDGGVFTFGDAAFEGSAGNLVLNAPAVGMAPDTATGGYWFVAADGGVFSYGAPFFGAG
ncbi:MAG: CAP domain-containing protein [Acidimicrobiales bacterium]